MIRFGVIQGRYDGVSEYIKSISLIGIIAFTAERLNMTEGISKEELIRLKETMTDGQSKLFIHLLIKKCTELDPWLPIDENTPKNRKILISDGFDQWISIYDKAYECWILDNNMSVDPTHWQELPENPKC